MPWLRFSRTPKVLPFITDISFRPVMHHFFLERFLLPSDWFDKRLAYTRSVATSSMVCLHTICNIDLIEVSIITEEELA